jgi:hypothetical protein
MIDRLKLYMELRWRPARWIVAAAGIRGEREVREAERAVANVAEWLLGQNEETLARLAAAVERPGQASIEVRSGDPKDTLTTDRWLVKVLDRQRPLGDRPAKELNLTDVNDLRDLLDFLEGMEWPVFLRCLDIVGHDKDRKAIFEGDAIEAGASSFDRLKTVIAVSYEGRMHGDGFYRELLWSDARGYFAGDGKLNMDTQHSYNHHVFTMHQRWHVVGNIYVDGAFLRPPVGEVAGDTQ